MPVRCVHKVPLRIVAERLDERAIDRLLEIDESPRTEQCLA
jgi:hypothetical protein